MSAPTADLSVYLVLDAAVCEIAGADPVHVVREAVAGGATTVQVRAKDLSSRAFTELAAAIAGVLPDRVPLVINDRADVALALRARGLRCDGVHVGQSDIPVEDLRMMLGDGAIIGLSASTPDQLAAAATSPARVDCVGIGPLHSTTSKADAPAGLGLDTVTDLARACPLPAVAIGGITPDDMAPLRRAGLAGGAVVSYICAADDPRAATERLASAWKEGA